MRKINGKKNLLGVYIKECREIKKLNRNDLSKKLQLLGINLLTDDIYKIETNRVMLKDFEFVAIAKILDIDMNETKKFLN